MPYIYLFRYLRFLTIFLVSILFMSIFFVAIFLVVIRLVKLDSGHVVSPTRVHITLALRTLLQVACSGVSSETALWLFSTLLYALREV